MAVVVITACEQDDFLSFLPEGLPHGVKLLLFGVIIFHLVAFISTPTPLRVSPRCVRANRRVYVIANLVAGTSLLFPCARASCACSVGLASAYQDYVSVVFVSYRRQPSLRGQWHP